jgi:acetyltransferase-like isoleucine patch superfamily enzyme
VLRGAFIGRGTVVAAHAVVRDGVYPDLAILGGTPARVLKDRAQVYESEAAKREALADIARKHQRAAQRARELDQ